MTKETGDVTVPPLDIDSLLGNTKNHIERVGVELEGAWKKVPAGVSLERDTSVFKAQGNQVPGHQVGEIPIPPVIPMGLGRLMKKYYPDLVDSSCGMHVHMSFETLWAYGTLMVPEYQETIIEYLKRWAEKEGFPAKHHIWPRLRGESVYCQKKFWPQLQADYKQKDHNQERKGHRYTIVNYVNRPGKQTTIEIRVLPMMLGVEQAMRAVDMVLDITNACLIKLGKRDGRFGDKIDMPNGMVYEESFEEEVPLTSKARKSVFSGGGGW
jgi:hypothetical protein